MTRFKLTIEYDGTPYAGWQRQDDQPSIQGSIERALYQFAQEDVTIQCAGRTDAGVHARGQVAHLDLTKDRTPFQLSEGLNFYLKDEPIVILSAEVVDDDFNARFSAIHRAYEYRIINRRTPLAIDLNRAWHIPWELDVAAMQAAANRLLGTHDFTSFRASHCQSKSPVKTLDTLTVTRRDDGIVITTSARSFLHHQVRNMVGTLSLVGSGKWQLDDVSAALAAKDRTRSGPTAPAWGLTLMEVTY